jgi:phenylacetate-CoA ligase
MYEMVQTARFLMAIQRNPWRPPQTLQKMREEMLKSVLQHAYTHTTFYRRLYRKHGITPEDIRSFEDITKLPIVSKQSLRACSIQERTSRLYNLKTCYEGHTSGSTGEPFRVYTEPRAFNYQRALHARRLFIYGYKPWNTIVIFGPYWAGDTSIMNSKRLRAGLLNTLNFDANRLSLLDDPVENLAVLRAIQPQVIWCPPSYLELLAEAAHHRCVSDVRPQLIICGAEMLDPKTRKLAESVFHTEIFDEYGTVDVASRNIAWQCHRHDGYHINLDAVHLEFVRDGELVAPGEEGQIVATNLFRYATPMIRYMIGDIGVHAEAPCPCGRGFPLMRSIEGRSDDHIVLSNGRLISPLVVLIRFRAIPGVHRFQLVQEAIDQITVFIEPITEASSPHISVEVHDICTKLFNNMATIRLVFGPITIPKGRKYRAIQSRVVRTENN